MNARTPISWIILLLLAGMTARAQNFAGTNAPNTGTNFSFSVAPGTTNLSLVISNSSTAYSYLLLKKGGTPTDTDFDFISRINGRTNQINIELPELMAPTNYGLRVRTPAASVQHRFNVWNTTNRSDLRSSGYPLLKPFIFSTTGTLTNNPGGGTWHYYQVDVPTNLPGLRIALSHSGAGNPDLYVRKAQNPDTSNYDERSINSTIDTIILTDAEATNFTYFIAVHLPPGALGSANYTLSTELGYYKQLTWDPGTAHGGTQIHTNASPTGGDYFFRITTQNTAVGAWRTALYVDSGEADVSIRRAPFSEVPSAYNIRQSARVGSDGFVIHSSEFAAAQEWWILVRATPGAQWRLFTGEAYVLNLGTLTSDGSSGSGPVPMGAEGMRFFRTTTTPTTLAWGLWLNGLNNQLMVRKTAVPHPLSAGTSDWNSFGQMLLVPSYLVGGDSYFIGVVGDPGLTINLDSRQHGFTDIAFNSSSNITLSGYGYVTYRVQVPVQQIAWLTTVTPSSGNANVAIRRALIPNEFFNDAYSDVGGSVADSVSLVPSTLSDGTFFITVYGGTPFTCTLTTGNPVITDVAFVSTTMNNDPGRVGWRYYRVPDIASQLGSLGWDLLLSGHAAGTEIAIRQNAVPSRWNYRDGTSNHSSRAHVDYTGGTSGFLQRPGHQADIWYIGVYNPSNALGGFNLILQQLQAALTAFDGGTMTRTGTLPGRWEYFRIDIPDTCLGWDVRLINVPNDGGQPILVVRRDQLPDALSTGPWSFPQVTANWPSGYRWRAGGDWTGRNLSPSGTIVEDNRILAMGLGRPLEPGTYYVGVNNNTGNPMTFTVQSRGIGTGLIIPVQTVAFSGGSVTNTLVPREAAYYCTVIPSNTPSWKVKLRAAAGESLLIALKDVLPSVLPGGGVTGANDSGRVMQKISDEHFVLLPASGQSNLIAGTYYLTVVSEGMNTTNNNRIGVGTSTFELTSEGILPVTSLGTLIGPDLVLPDSLEGGEAAAYQFTLPPGTLAMEVRLEDRVGNPGMALIRNDNSPAPNTGAYGAEGGQLSGRLNDDALINVANPAAGTWSIVVKANPVSGNYLPATYTLRVRRVEAVNVTFDNGASTVINHEAGTWRYFRIDVPANPLGWDIRLINVATSGLPAFSVRRDLAPASLGTTPWSFPQLTANWPSGYQWSAGYDWTGRQYGPDGRVDEYARILAVGMGRPLEPGTYYIGVINRSGSGTNALSYTLLSRGIGTNMTIPVQTLAFSGGTVTTNGLPAREAAYYCVDVPPGTPSWKMKLSTNAGESLLIAVRGVIPSTSAGGGAAGLTDGGALMQKVGNEHFVLLPQQGTSSIPAGRYYIAVPSEGTNTTNTSRIGAGASSFTFQSLGPLPILDLGTLGPVDLTHNGALEGGEIAAYQFTVPSGVSSMEVRLENRVGNPAMALLRGTNLPNTGGYGVEGGHTTFGGSSRILDDFLITVANPSNGVYSLIVKANPSSGIYSNATYTVRVAAVTVTATPLAFDGGSTTVANHPAGTWRYYRVDVPAGALGWDIRLVNVATGCVPRLVVRRDQFPLSLSTTPWSFPQLTPNWPSGHQWGAPYDWTGRQFSADGREDEYGRILAMGMGRPLEPGTYYIGVINGTGSALMNYTVLSRGIGATFAIPVSPVSFGGGSVMHSGLVPREAAYYSVVIPPNTPSWKVRLQADSGDSVLAILKDVVPGVAVDSTATGFNSSGREMQKAGNEHFVLLPVDGQTNVPGGLYYLSVASEGVNLTNSSRIGSGTSSFVLTSERTLAITSLGSVGGPDLVALGNLEGGEVAAYQFAVPPGTPAIEARLDNRVGNPRIALRPGAGLPLHSVSYGEEGGYSNGRLQDNVIITIANPSNGVHSLTVFADAISSAYPDSTYTLNVRHVPVLDLNFAPNLNTNGNSNIATGLLANDQRAFFRVVVPSMNNGHPVVGWRLTVRESFGRADVRVRKDLLPADSVFLQAPFNRGDVVIVRPYLTPGIWYVEVKGTGSTDYILESDELLMERPCWEMPMLGQPTTTPGLVAPNFGDSGINPAGNPLPGDQGIDLEQGYFHYYCVNVPDNNSGVMRVILEAISGDPDFYMRYAIPPTLAHGQSGPHSAVPLYERYLDDATTEYANWVSMNGRYERELTNGVHYIAIRASGNSNVRYRLRLSAGDIQDLALNGGALNNQILAAGDWRYYRVQIPTNAPRSWNVTFNQIVGDVIMYVRDTSPPGHGIHVTDYQDWQDDSKNHGPYPTYDAAGTHTILCPALRPAHTYFLGFRAVNDATFSVSSGTGGGIIEHTNVVAFYGGVTNTTIAPNGLLRFRVDVPTDARRWIHYATNPATVRIYIDQGSCPTLTAQDHYSCQSINCTLNRELFTASNWPWHSGYMYFVTVTNTSALSQSFYFRMDGRNCLTDDNDNDMLPDCWELSYWVSIGSYGRNSDPDGDGVWNIDEYLNGSNPTLIDTVMLANPASLPNGHFQFWVLGPTNGRYRLQGSTAFATWSLIRQITNAGGMTLVTDTNATSFSRRFYRAISP